MSTGPSVQQPATVRDTDGPENVPEHNYPDHVGGKSCRLFPPGTERPESRQRCRSDLRRRRHGGDRTAPKGHSPTQETHFLAGAFCQLHREPVGVKSIYCGNRAVGTQSKQGHSAAQRRTGPFLRGGVVSGTAGDKTGALNRILRGRNFAGPGHISPNHSNLARSRPFVRFPPSRAKPGTSRRFWSSCASTSGLDLGDRGAGAAVRAARVSAEFPGQ